VKPKLKWHVEKKKTAVSTASKKGKDAETATPNALPGGGGGANGYGPGGNAPDPGGATPFMQPYNYNDPLPGNGVPNQGPIPYQGQGPGGLPGQPHFGQGPIAFSSPETAHLDPHASQLSSHHPFAQSGGTHQETTQQFQMSPEDHQKFAHADGLDPEETVDLPGSAMSVLLPFHGKK
jgi:hypothetical protein